MQELTDERVLSKSVHDKIRLSLIVSNYSKKAKSKIIRAFEENWEIDNISVSKVSPNERNMVVVGKYGLAIPGLRTSEAADLIAYSLCNSLSKTEQRSIRAQVYISGVDWYQIIDLTDTMANEDYYE